METYSGYAHAAIFSGKFGARCSGSVDEHEALRGL